MPGTKHAAGYMVIKNKGTKSDALVKVETLFSDNVEFHEMSMKNNIMKMKKKLQVLQKKQTLHGWVLEFFFFYF